MNPSEWTNAVKASAISLVNGIVALSIAAAVMLGWQPDVNQLTVLTAAIDVVVNAAAAFWILLTYRDSPARAQDSVLKERGLQP